MEKGGGTSSAVGAAPVLARRTDFNLLDGWGSIGAVYFSDIALGRGTSGIGGTSQFGATDCGLSARSSGESEASGHLQFSSILIGKTSKVKKEPRSLDRS